ncbi:hypothetical protein Bbelb_370630 [Branchiostoma belcheri]|nr:hypothetical protein Bbelb_370630 [Branchiostoma belcheri]
MGSCGLVVGTAAPASRRSCGGLRRAVSHVVNSDLPLRLFESLILRYEYEVYYLLLDLFGDIPLCAATHLWHLLKVPQKKRHKAPRGGARPRLVEPSSDTGTKLARSTHEFKNFAQVGRGTKEGHPNISRSSREGRPRNTAETRGMYARISVDSRPHRGELQASYARAGNELCDLKNRRRLVADVKNTFRVSASFGRLQKIAGDPENSRNARRNIGRTTAVNVV